MFPRCAWATVEPGISNRARASSLASEWTLGISQPVTPCHSAVRDTAGRPVRVRLTFLCCPSALGERLLAGSCYFHKNVDRIDACAIRPLFGLMFDVTPIMPPVIQTTCRDSAAQASASGRNAASFEAIELRFASGSRRRPGALSLHRPRLLRNHQSEKLNRTQPRTKMPAISHTTNGNPLPFKITP